MPLIPISIPSDPRVADYRAIPEPELLRTRGLFVAEGRVVVGRLLRSTRYRTRSLLVTTTALEGLAQADNVGGVFRNAAAFGADAVLLDSACCDPLYCIGWHDDSLVSLAAMLPRLADPRTRRARTPSDNSCRPSGDRHPIAGFVRAGAVFRTKTAGLGRQGHGSREKWIAVVAAQTQL